MPEKLKRILPAFFYLISSLSVIQANAQKIQAGLKGGINLSNVTGNAFSVNPNNTYIGFHAGVFVKFKLPLLSVQPEILLSTAGTRINENDVVQNLEITYLSLPIMLQAKLFRGLFIEAGPQLSFKLAERIGLSNYENFVKNLDLSAGGGLGYQLGPIHFYMRYMAGLSKVGDFDASRPNFKNGIWQGGVGLRLAKKK